VIRHADAMTEHHSAPSGLILTQHESSRDERTQHNGTKRDPRDLCHRSTLQQLFHVTDMITGGG
jgi:hypothetical protein